MKRIITTTHNTGLVKIKESPTRRIPVEEVAEALGAEIVSMDTIDWRTDIKNHDSLEGLDSIEIMIYLRHSYLTAAKDLIHRNNGIDSNLGIKFSNVAAYLQAAIEEASDL